MAPAVGLWDFIDDDLPVRTPREPRQIKVGLLSDEENRATGWRVLQKVDNRCYRSVGFGLLAGYDHRIYPVAEQSVSHLV